MKEKRVLDFYSKFCGACRMLNPIVEEIEKEYVGGVVFNRYDIDEKFELANVYGVKYLPTLILLEDGAEVGRIVGYRDKEEILAFLGLGGKDEKHS